MYIQVTALIYSKVFWMNSFLIGNEASTRSLQKTMRIKEKLVPVLRNFPREPRTYLLLFRAGILPHQPR